jgi:N-acetylglutamate synthase/N-acetylornithine aminotransferase
MAVVVNSGSVNAVTGKKGLEDAWFMVRETVRLLREEVGKVRRSGEEWKG